MMNIIRYVIAAILLSILSLNVSAQQVSAQQIEQFKKLPKSQQQALAKSMGVDLNAIEAQLSGSSEKTSPVNTPIVTREVNELKAKGEEETEKAEAIFKELPRFGLDVFANEPATFSPVMDIAIPEVYTLGTGDSVSIQVFGKENREMQLTINREGQLVFPNLGPIRVAGLTFSELKSFVVIPTSFP